MLACENLIVVAGHAPFKADVDRVPPHPERDDFWVLQPFQRGEPPLYIEHIRRGVALLEKDPKALLIFSGGFTRNEAGLRWSEAATYMAIAQHLPECSDNLADRIAAEDYSRDSFENLLFSLCRFQQIIGRYPRRFTIVSWAFKQKRFDFHRASVRFPSARFHFEGCNQPLTLESALQGEAVTFREFLDNKYGSSGKLAAKRAARNPFDRQHDFASCPGLKQFFAFMADPKNGQSEYPQRLPWED